MSPMSLLASIRSFSWRLNSLLVDSLRSPGFITLYSDTLPMATRRLLATVNSGAVVRSRRKCVAWPFFHRKSKSIKRGPGQQQSQKFYHFSKSLSNISTTLWLCLNRRKKRNFTVISLRGKGKYYDSGVVSFFSGALLNNAIKFQHISLSLYFLFLPYILVKSLKL